MLRVEKKIKSMQMFRKPVPVARQGDRVGMCVAQLEASAIERGLACTPGSMKTCETVLAAVSKIKFFLDPVTQQKVVLKLQHRGVEQVESVLYTPDVEVRARGRRGQRAST